MATVPALSTAAVTPVSASAAMPLRTRISRAVFPYLLVLPTFLFIFMFTLWPAVSAVIQSTMKPLVATRNSQPIDATSNQAGQIFVGLNNYVELFNSNSSVGQYFPQIFLNTLLFVAVTVLVSMIFAFLLALMLNRKVRAIGLFRFAFFYPVLMPMIGAASIFAFIFSNNLGLANTVLHTFGITGPQWIGDPYWTRISIMIVAIWKQTGFFMIIYLAGMQTLPQDVYEAADLDGANWLRKITAITLPLLSSVTIFILTSGVAGAFQTVDQLFALGNGQPSEKSNLLLYYIFQLYNEPANAGLVNAMTVVLLVILLCFTLFNFTVLERRVYYES